MSLTVYVAGAFSDRKRVVRAMGRVDCNDRHDLKLAHDWVAVIDDKVGGDQTREADLPPEVRLKAADDDIVKAFNADVFWFLVPANGGRGCWFETGAVQFGRVSRRAYKGTLFASPITIASGPAVGVTVFTEQLDYKFADDDEAFEFICKRGWV